MKKIKIPHHSFLITDICLPEEACKIQEFAKKLGYDLSLDECKDLWIIFNEAAYCDEKIEVSLESVQKAITYIERGLIWSNPIL